MNLEERRNYVKALKNQREESRRELYALDLLISRQEAIILNESGIQKPIENFDYKFARKEAGLTRKELSTLANVGQSTIVNLEAGQSIRRDLYDRIIKALNIEP